MMEEYLCNQCGCEFKEPKITWMPFSVETAVVNGVWQKTVKEEQVKVSPCCSEEYETWIDGELINDR